ncbi:hypothetical protein PMSD_19485 [Paenibacillus macquariensis subsp. defensor]|nr:hypothetical protein PMSD_19485 [Paenibacillus macquariensis subsp. defensor]
MIQFQGINKVYENGNVVLKDINLTIKEGEITVLIGPSGCGKTTTMKMKMINRLIKPSKGTITLHGEDISTMDPVTLRRKIGYVIQSIGLFPHMNIAKNVGHRDSRRPLLLAGLVHLVAVVLHAFPRRSSRHKK